MGETKSEFRFGILVFVTVLLVVGVIKQVPIFSSAIILDDMQLFAASIYGDLADRSLYFLVYSFHNKMLHDPASVRFLYLIVFSLCGALTYILLNQVLKSKLASLLIVLLLLVNPTTAVLIIFINGSYNVLFYFLFCVGTLLIGLHIFRYYQFDRSLMRAAVFVSALLFMTLAIQFTTNGVLLPLAVLMLPWWRSELFRRNRKQLLLVAGVFVVISGISIFVRILSVAEHPYTTMSGRLVFDPQSMVKYAFILISKVLNSYVAPPTSTGVAFDSNFTLGGSIPAILVAVSCLLASIAVMFSASIRRKILHRIDVLSILPFIATLIVLSVGPLTPNVIVHLWHYFLPSVFLLLFLVLLVFVFVRPALFYVLGVSLFVISISSLSHQMNSYDRAAEEQEKLIDFLRTSSQEWESEAQVIVATEKIPYLSGFGLLGGIRDLNYMRFQTARPDIGFAGIATEYRIGVIAAQSVLNFDRPTYVYRYNYSAGKAEQLDYLLMETDSLLRLLTASSEGISSFRQMTTETMPNTFRELGLSLEDVVFLRGPKDLREFVYEGTYLSFDGDDFREEVITIADTPTSVTFETVLLAKSSSCEGVSVASDACPPMPLVAYPLSIYQKNDMYVIQIQDPEGYRYVNYDLGLEQWHKFVFTFDLESKVLYIVIDDMVHTILRDVDLEVIDITAVTLGKGYRERFWVGDVGFFRIYGINGATKNYYLNVSQ